MATENRKPAAAGGRESAGRRVGLPASTRSSALPPRSSAWGWSFSSCRGSSPRNCSSTRPSTNRYRESLRPPRLERRTAIRRLASPRRACRSRAGRFRSLEHATTGRAIVLRRPAGHLILRLERLSTSNGPDLRVYLSRVPASSDVHACRTGFIDLGALQGNRGSQNYAIPAGTDLSAFNSAVIWVNPSRVSSPGRPGPCMMPSSVRWFMTTSLLALLPAGGTNPHWHR